MSHADSLSSIFGKMMAGFLPSRTASVAASCSSRQAQPSRLPTGGHAASRPKVASEKKKSPACRGEGSAAGLQLRVRFVPAALPAMLKTALALQCVSKARDWTSHVAR
jgi:hypothetical protein